MGIDKEFLCKLCTYGYDDDGDYDGDICHNI